jgi:hypothetical protein
MKGRPALLRSGSAGHIEREIASRRLEYFDGVDVIKGD